MRNTSFLPIRSMTRQDVLNTIRDSYRFAQKLDPEAEPGYHLTFDTSVEDWRIACDLLPARELGQALNVWFNVDFDNVDWIATLEPAKTATLGGVCDLVASKAKMPDMQEFPILGADCLSAGVFLTIRSALKNEGVPSDGFRPSTPIEPVAREHLFSLINVVGRVAPDVLPVPDIKYKLSYQISLWLCGSGLILTLIFGVLGDWKGSSKLTFFSVASLVSLVLGVTGALLINYLGVRYKSVSFARIRTFRDLVGAIIKRMHPNTHE